MKLEEDLVFDVGMNEGEDAAFYLAKKFRVVGVEASADLCAEARNRLDQHVRTGDFCVENVAVAEHHGPIRFYINPNSAWNTTYTGWAERNSKLGSEATEVVDVLGTPFESLLEKYGVPYYLKIDIEGADLLCLMGLKNFSERPPYVSIESEKVSWKKLNEELDMLEALGYDRFKVVPQHKIGGSTLSTRVLDGSALRWTFEPGSSGAFGRDLKGRWLTRAQVLRRYRLIFLRYQLIGDAGLLTRGTHTKKGLARFLVKVPARIVRLVIGPAGWYDTHARHVTAD